MAGHGIEDDPNLKGLSRIFNAETNRGRGNVSQLPDFISHRFRQLHQTFSDYE